jgi:hypothetical protein
MEFFKLSPEEKLEFDFQFGYEIPAIPGKKYVFGDTLCSPHHVQMPTIVAK